ncbi:MAG: LamG domain-containing protein, partial [Dehalococcoidales bacterium]|nr:LamG domain-containing protein [Dehalococcoidales bacterium]
MRYKLFTILLFITVGFFFANGASAAITSGNYTLKLSGGDYSSWHDFWTDLGSDLTGDITLTVDASAFTENSATLAIVNLQGYTLKVTAATFPSTTDGSTGPRFTFNNDSYFWSITNSRGPGTIIIEGIVFIKGTGTSASVFDLNNVLVPLTFIARRNIIKGGSYAFLINDTDPTYYIYNNIIFNQTSTGWAGGIGCSTGAGFTGFWSNNTIVDVTGVIGGRGITNNSVGSVDNNLVYNSLTQDFGYIGNNCTGFNNSSYDATADDFKFGADNRINKTDSPFTNYDADDFTLAPGSDPIDNGTSSPSAYFTDDFFGNTRSEPWDIGAVEYVPSIVTSAGFFTVSAWVKPTTAIATKAIAVKNNEIRLVTDSSGKPVCQIHNGTAWQTAVTSTVALTLNAWQYVACTYDGTNLKVFVNGISQGSQALTENPADTINVWQLGKDAGSTYGYFQGVMDDVQIYNYARTPKQIMEDMNAGHPAVGSPVGSYTGYWPMDEGNGSTTYDKSLSKNNGTLTGGVQWTNNGKFGKALSFDGADDYVIATDPNHTSANLTVSAWVKADTFDATVSSILMYRALVSGWENNRFQFFLTSAKKLSFGIGISSTGYVTVGNTAFVAGTWYHVVGVYDGAKVRVYLNGIEDQPSPTSAIGDVNNNSAWDLYIGTGTSVTLTNYSWDGLIDEVK